MIFKLTNYIRGFSLIEIMVAFAILSVSFLAIMASFPFGVSINKEAENNTIAANLAQKKIEEVISSEYVNIAVGEIESKHRLASSTADYLYNYQRETTANYLDSNLTATTTDTGLKKISTTVYYTNSISKSEKSYNTTTIISQK
jgi:prepilin-type N-terminal cleavage/methylation domain-containing protein